ncbi:hypothetical protein HCN44_003443 [Aphidius gifuensis]|uniref:Uncharacterized protein n=1 Tax=Aphidius gifuensis TaxID=684658 RepID=A0A834XLJ3_APHGI|nr:hypothetical protein HCN44_003443 [Aphidius gifuensis]
MNSLASDQSNNPTPDARMQPTSINYSVQSLKKKTLHELTVVSVAHTNIPLKEPVVYSKQTQTAQASLTSL